jgi:hypothetical protein
MQPTGGPGQPPVIPRPLRRYRRLAAACERGEPRSEELQVYADFLRIVLEVLNTVITAGLPHNPELVYALLHRQEVFTPFEVRPLTIPH